MEMLFDLTALLGRVLPQYHPLSLRFQLVGRRGIVGLSDVLMGFGGWWRPGIIQDEERVPFVAASMPPLDGLPYALPAF